MTRVVVGALVAACVCSAAGCSRRTDFERMRLQQRTDPYESSAAFADGVAMRVPPAGTVPRAERAVPAAVETGLQDGAPVRDIPIAVTPEVVARGARQFGIYCAVCHGADASGRSIMAVNMIEAPPPSLLTGHAAALPSGGIFRLITRGGKRMPSYGWSIPTADRWAIIAFVRTLQRQSETDSGAAR